MRACYSQNIIYGEDRQQLVEGLSAHVWREESHYGGDVGDETKESQTREENTFTPELVLLPHLQQQRKLFRLIDVG